MRHRVNKRRSSGKFRRQARRTNGKNVRKRGRGGYRI